MKCVFNEENFDSAPDGALVSLKIASAILQRHIATLYRDHKAGRLPFVKVGNSTRVRVGDLRRIINGQ